MLGLVFTELLDMIESRYSPELANRVRQRSELTHGGAYTTIGYYPPQEILRIFASLSDETGQPADTMIRAFGHHLLERFAGAFPDLFAGKPTLYDFLASIEGHVHSEVQKVYPEARLPRMQVLARGPGHLHLAYHSPQRMEVFATGLLEGAAHFYGEPQAIRIATDASLAPDTLVFELSART